MYKKVIFSCVITLIGLLIQAQVNIVPLPVEVTIPSKAGSFSINSKTVIITSKPSLKNSADFFNDYLKQLYAFNLKTSSSAKSNVIVLDIQKKAGSISGAYNMQVKNTGVYIQGFDEAGVFYGIQSLIQLLPVTTSNAQTGLSIPLVNIKDYPRFSYRGMHLDVARHFFPVSFIKKYIDYIALHKMNYFHWHLTEDQGWRIEIKKYPKLTEIGAYRNGTIIGHFPGTGNDNKRVGGFYTQEEVKDVVKYASARYVTIIPEIEMPGHSAAAIAAYTELSCFPQENTRVPRRVTWSGDSTGKQVQQAWGVFNDIFAPTDTTFKFLENVLDEVMALFPAKYIHIGGDECPKENWKRSDFCQQLIKEKGLKDEHGLQSYFIQRMEKYINSKGKLIIGWDEILEGGLAPNAMVMSWRGEKGGIDAANQDHYVIMTPGSHCYFDHSQSGKEDSLTFGGFTTVQKVYSYEPVPKDLPADKQKFVLGSQGNVWSEYMEYPVKVEYQIFPRMTALSEVLCSPRESRKWETFEPRLREQFKRYDLWKVGYSKAVFDPASTEPPVRPNRRRN